MEITDHTRYQLARYIYRQRRLRAKFFSPRWFRDPAWDILLDLYIARHERRKVYVSSACLATDVPQTTALRCLAEMEKGRLIRRARARRDRRIVFLSLTPGAARRMGALLDRLIAELQR